jgi:CelD/BcsL family acetyltransferase involved in cellulose biosynthesis
LRLVHVEVVRPGELGAAELARWRELQRTDPLQLSPFLAAEFTQGVGRFRDDVRVGVVSDGGRIVAFFPYERSRIGAGHPVGFGLTDVQGIVADPELELAPQALLKACGLGVWEFDHLLAGQRMFAPFHQVSRAEPVMDLSGGFDAYLAGTELKRARYKERKLGRDVGELRHVYSTKDPEDLRRLMEWKSDQYRRTGRMDRFARPWIVALVEHFHQTGFGVLSVLYAGDEPVSTHFGLVNEGVMAGWFTVYDTRFHKYSPGMIGHLAMARSCPENGVDIIHMGRGGKEFKERLKTGEFPIAEGRVTRPTLAATSNWLLTAPLNKARNAALDNPKLYAGADAILRTYARLRRR